MKQHLKNGLPYGWWKADGTVAMMAALALGGFGGVIIAAWFGLLG